MNFSQHTDRSDWEHAEPALRVTRSDIEVALAIVGLFALVALIA